MLKLIDKGVAKVGESDKSTNLIRIGRSGSCHTGVHEILATRVAAALNTSAETGGDAHDLPSADALRSVMAKARIVGVTALTIPRSPLLIDQHFDVVIVDEAGQINQPAILGALMAADTFVLVGDHQVS